jgi:hypothetical protein
MHWFLERLRFIFTFARRFTGKRGFQSCFPGPDFDSRRLAPETRQIQFDGRAGAHWMAEGKGSINAPATESRAQARLRSPPAVCSGKRGNWKGRVSALPWRYHGRRPARSQTNLNKPAKWAPSIFTTVVNNRMGIDSTRKVVRQTPSTAVKSNDGSGIAQAAGSYRRSYLKRVCLTHWGYLSEESL